MGPITNTHTGSTCGFIWTNILPHFDEFIKTRMAFMVLIPHYYTPEADMQKPFVLMNATRLSCSFSKVGQWCIAQFQGFKFEFLVDFHLIYTDSKVCYPRLFFFGDGSSWIKEQKQELKSSVQISDNNELEQQGNSLSFQRWTPAVRP